MSTNQPPPYPDGSTPPTAPVYGEGATPPAQGYPPPASGGYPPPGAYPPAPGGYGGPPKLNTKALLSMIFGIVGVVLLCITFGGLFGLASIPLGIIGSREIKQSNGTQKGNGMAIAGIVTGAIALVVMIVVIVLVATGVIDTTNVE